MGKHTAPDIAPNVTDLLRVWDQRIIDDTRTLAACQTGDEILNWYTEHGRDNLSLSREAAPYAAGFGVLAALASELIGIIERHRDA